MGQPPSPFPVGWHPDPTARYELRYFNGETWTADVSSAGQRFVDAFGTPKRHRDGRATAAMVLGIVGVTLGWMPLVFVVGAVCSLLAIIFGAIVVRGRTEPRGFALTGMITGVAGLLLVVVGVVTTRAVSNALNDFVDEPRAVVALDRCVAEDDQVTIEGTIENVGDRPSDYRVVVRVGQQPSLSQRIVIEVDDVRPGRPMPFSAAPDVSFLDDPSDVTCKIVDITGPPPFGLDL